MRSCDELKLDMKRLSIRLPRIKGAVHVGWIPPDTLGVTSGLEAVEMSGDDLPL